MKKRLYNSPLTEVMLLNTELMQHVSTTSEGDNQFPKGPVDAPERRVGAF